MGKKGQLSPKQERFVHEYLVDANGAQAAIRSGYSKKGAKEAAYDLLQEPHIKAAINELKLKQQERLEISADDILRELFTIATTNLKDAFDENGQLLPIREMPDSIAKAISGLDVYKDFTEGVEIGETRRVKLWDKIQALTLLGKHLKLFADRVEHVADTRTVEEIKEEIKRLQDEVK